MIKRLLALIQKEFIQLRRDWLFLLMILIGCPAEMSAVAYATGQEVENLPLAICDYDRSEESRRLVETLANTTTFDLIGYTTNQKELAEMLDQNVAYAALIVPPNFSEELLSSTTRPAVQVLVNGSESAAASEAYQTIEGALLDYGYQVMPGLTATLAETEHLQPSLRVWYNEELRKANYTIPSELGFILYVIAMWVAVLSVARERELGTLEQLMVTPLRKAEIVIGKSIPAVIIAYINFILMLGLVVFVFKVPMRGSLPLLLALAFFYILVELMRGLLISVISRTQQQGLMIVFLMAFVDMTFSGYAVPVESMPMFFQKLSNVFPIRHWMIIMRGIMLKDIGMDVFWRHVAAIGGLGVILTVGTLLAFRQALSQE
jgi:ABC-2 type transport system permease protein